jgi:hypothetical protein
MRTGRTHQGRESHPGDQLTVRGPPARLRRYFRCARSSVPGCGAWWNGDVSGAGAGLSALVTLWKVRGGPWWSAGSGQPRQLTWRWPRRAPLALALGQARGLGGDLAAGVGGFRREGVYCSCVHFGQPAGRQHRCPAEGERRRLRGAGWHVEGCFLGPCAHGRGPAETRHGTGRHGECRQRRQDVHDDCSVAVAGPAPSQHL